MGSAKQSPRIDVSATCEGPINTTVSLAAVLTPTHKEQT